MKKQIGTARTLLLAGTLASAAAAHAQLMQPTPIPPREPAKVKKVKPQHDDVEWLWQYSPPPAEGRENDLIQDPHFLPFLKQYLTAPQAFWGPQQEGRRKTLADTAYDFLAVPGKVIQDDNRYITATGSVFRVRGSRGLLFVDLNEAHPLVVFAAIDWIRDGKTTDDPAAEYTLWIFPNRAPGPTSEPQHLAPALQHSLARWLAEPVAGQTTPQKVAAAILVDADGTPHKIPVPTEKTP